MDPIDLVDYLKAVVTSDGVHERKTMVDGLVHSVNDEPALTIKGSGAMYWFYAGMIHRDMGPAIKYVWGDRLCEAYYNSGRLIETTRTKISD